VITEAGNHPKVAGLAYIAAFAPDKGESVATLNKHAPPGAPVSPILPPQDGYLFQDKAKFPASFAADVDAEKATFWADSQVPWGVAAQLANQRGGASLAGPPPCFVSCSGVEYSSARRATPPCLFDHLVGTPSCAVGKVSPSALADLRLMITACGFFASIDARKRSFVARSRARTATQQRLRSCQR
jgi:hypothetical protein